MFLIYIFIFSASVFAEPSLTNFAPGAYKLVDGKMENCDEGKFGFIEDESVAFGAFQLFALKPSRRILPGSTEDDRHCQYHGTDTVSVTGSQTTLGLESKKVCPDGVHYTLSKAAVVTRSRIVVDASLKRGPSAVDEEEYAEHCVWVRQK